MEDAPPAVSPGSRVPLRSTLFRTILGGLAVFCALAAVAAPSAHATVNLDPFRHVVKQAAPEKTGLAEPRSTAQTTAQTPQPTSNVTTPVASTPTSRPPSQACRSDDDCSDNNICQAGQCRLIQQTTNILYLYYREGSFMEIFGLYWSKRGTSGYTVLFPIYWSFHNPKGRSRVVAPFYWHFEDDAQQRTSTVIVPGLPVSWSRQPDARSFGIWPLFYASTKFGWAAPLLGTFSVGNPDRGTSFGAVAFAYWWKRTPTDAFDLFVPFFVSTRSPASSFTFALPLTFYWRNGDNAHTVGPIFYRHSWKTGASTYTPLGFHWRDGEASSGSALWLYWYGRNRAKHTAHDVLFPLVWSFRGARSGATVVFPLLWDFWGPGYRTTIGLPVVHVRNGPTYVDTVAGLLWSAGNDTARWRMHLIVPAYFSYHGDGDRKRLWLSPIGGYSRNDDAGSRTLALLGLVVRRDRVRAFDLVTPFYIRHHHYETDAITRLLGGIVYLRDDPQGSTKVVFPVFWRFRDVPTGATATALLPLFFHRNGPRDRTTAVGVFPLWFYSRSFSDGGWSAGLTPFAFFGRRGDARHAVLLPFFWHLADARSSHTAVLPLYYANRDAHGGNAGILPLLTFFGSRDGDSYQVQFPLFWRFANARTGESATATPLGFYTRSPSGWKVGVGPILPILWAGGGGPRRHFVLFPILWHFQDDREDSSTTAFLNYVHHRHGGETTDALFPLLHYRRGARPGKADETSFTLFPLVHYRRDADTRVLLTPLWASAKGPRRSAGMLAYLYYWYEGTNFSARGVPLLFTDVKRRDTGEHTRQIGPWISIDDPTRQSHASVLFPLVGRYKDPNESDTWVFPSFFHQRKRDGYAVDTFLPLFWHSNWQGRTTTVVGPWYRRAGQGVHNTGLAPIYHWAKNPTRTLLVIPPLLTFHRRDFQADKSVTVVGNFLHRHTPESEWTVFFPFWWSGHDQNRSHTVLGPFYWHFEDRTRQSSWSLLLPFYWSRTGPATTRALLPVAWIKRDTSTQIGSEGFLPLFYSAHGPGRFTLLTLIGGFSQTPTARRWYAGPLYVSDTVQSRSRVLFPIYFDHLSRPTETRTRVIPPLLHLTRSTPEKSISTTLLLYWRRTDVASATTFVLPLYFDVHDYRDSRTTVLFPLFLRHRNEITNHAFWLAPLVYRRSTPTDATTVVFPLFWDYKHTDSRTTICIPLFAHWTRPTYAGTYVFPNVYFRRGLAAGTPNGTWRLFVPPLFDAAVDRPGDFRWEILGGLFGKERIGRNHYLKLFFFSIQTQKPSATQTAWYGRSQPSARGRAEKSLATHVW